MSLPAPLSPTFIMSNIAESSNTVARVCDQSKFSKGPSEAEVIRTLYGWLRTGHQAWAEAEGQLLVILGPGVEGDMDEARQITLACSCIESSIEQYWHLDRFIKTGRLHSELQDNVRYTPSTWSDLEGLRQETDASLPEEMTSAWLKTLFMSLGGHTALHIDFSWAAPRYTDRFVRALSVTTRTPLLDRILSGEATEEHRVLRKNSEMSLSNDKGYRNGDSQKTLPRTYRGS